MAAPFPPLGPPRRVPQLQRYYGAVRLPVPLSPRLVAFAWRYPASRPSIRSQRPRTPDRGPGVHTPVPTTGKIRREASRASQVPGQPAVPMPCSSTPAGPNTPGHCGMSAWPPLCPQRRLPRLNPAFEAQWHGLGTRCLRFVRYSCPHPTQNSLPAAGQALPDGIGYPQGCYERFLTMSSSFPELILAQGHSGCFLEVVGFHRPYRVIPSACGGAVHVNRGLVMAREASMPPRKSRPSRPAGRSAPTPGWPRPADQPTVTASNR